MRQRQFGKLGNHSQFNGLWDLAGRVNKRKREDKAEEVKKQEEEAKAWRMHRAGKGARS